MIIKVSRTAGPVDIKSETDDALEGKHDEPAAVIEVDTESEDLKNWDGEFIVQEGGSFFINKSNGGAKERGLEIVLKISQKTDEKQSDQKEDTSNQEEKSPETVPSTQVAGAQGEGEQQEAGFNAGNKAEENSGE
jgi:hypothetical protein